MTPDKVSGQDGRTVRGRCAPACPGVPRARNRCDAPHCWCHLTYRRIMSTGDYYTLRENIDGTFSYVYVARGELA
jgi:hypothetical protein